MTNYDNVLGSLARGGPGAVRYDGDSLTNDEEHQYRIDLAAMLERETELIKFPDNVGSGKTIAAAEEAISHLRGLLLNTADAARTIGEAAKKAAPAIRAGTAADPEVQEALRQSSAAYASVKDIVPPGSDDSVGSQHGEVGHGPAPGGPKTSPAPEESGPGPEVSPATQVSSAAPQAQAPVAAGQAQAPAQAAGMPQGAPMAGGPMPAGAGAPQTAPSGYGPGNGGGPAGGPQNKPRRREGDSGPTTYGSSSNGPEVGGGVMPIVNPSVTGGRIDPAQISGRTASTSPSAGLPPLKTGPAGSTGMMGGMGGMPLGGGPHGGSGGGGGRPNLPPLRRDRDSERILTGQEARDKALVSHILRDDDPVSGEYIDSAELLADVFPNERHPSPPQYSPAPIAPSSFAPAPETQLREPTPPMSEPVPPTGPLSEPVPPAPRGRGAAPIQRPGEPRDDELW